MSLSDTFISGYLDNIPVVLVKLPLKYFTNDSSLASGSADITSSSSFQSKLANRGSIISLSQIEGSVIDSVSYVLLNNLKTIRITPLLFQANSLNLRFQQIEVVLPHKVASSLCFSVYLHRDQDNSFLLVDVIDENYLFISVKISLNDFIRNSTQKKSRPFQLDRFEEWGHISVPYSFELRSPPYLIRSITSKDLIVSLNDGGLLHFKRSVPLLDYQVYNFEEPKSILPFNLFKGLWGESKKANEFQKGESDKFGDVSANSLVDLISLTPNTFITLSINKVFKIWNLNTHKLAAPQIDLKKSADDSSFWLTASSVKYIQLIEYENKSYLTCQYYASRKGNNEEGNIVFKLWEVLLLYGDNIDLVEINIDQFNPIIESSNSTGSVWFIQDYFAQIFDGYVHYTLLWKTNTSTIVSCYKFNFATNSLDSVNWLYQSSNKSVLSTFSPYFDSTYYSDKILNSGYYNELIVKTALLVFRNHIGLIRDNDLSLANLSLRQSIIEVIKSTEDANTQRLNWYKLDSLCEEYKKLSEECFSILPSGRNDEGFNILNANGLTIARKSHNLETFSDECKKSNELSSILKDISILLSTKTYIKVYDRLVDTDTTIDNARVTDIYQTHLSSKISKEQVDAIVERLTNIPNVLDKINDLIDLPPNHIDFESEGETFNYESIGALTKLSAIISFKDIKTAHESILLGLSVLLLSLEVNETMLELISKIASRLARFKLLNTVFDTSFRNSQSHSHSFGSFSGKIERDNISNLENSIFWVGVVSHYPTLGEKIKQGSFNEAYNSFYSIVVNDFENFITHIIIELINHDEGNLIKEIFIQNLNQNDSIDKFLTGFVYLISNDSGEFFKNFEVDVFDFKDTHVKQLIKKRIFQALTMNNNIKAFLESIFGDELENIEDPLLEKANYYHALSILATSQSKTISVHSRFSNPVSSTFLTSQAKLGETVSNNEIEAKDSPVSFLSCAMYFEVKAIESLKSSNSSTSIIQEKLIEFNNNLFEMALNLNNYELIYQSLEYLDKYSSENQLRDIFTKFINNLISNKSISLVFKGNNWLFRKHYLLVDSILLGLANNELVLSHSLKFYEYLYSWRLFGASKGSSFLVGDKRSSIQALYIFITRFRKEHKYLLSEGNSTVETDEDIKQYKLKVLELYMIILNGLKSFSNNDDQWIIRISDSVDSMEVIDLDQLTQEYLEWLREIQNDMSEWL